MFEFLLFLQFILEPKKVRKLTISLVVIAALLGFGAPSAQAQDDVLAGISYSPYSLFGFGDLVRPGTTYNATMGGIGIGDRNVRYINIVNPAGVTAREGTLTFKSNAGEATVKIVQAFDSGNEPIIDGGEIK